MSTLTTRDGTAFELFDRQISEAERIQARADLIERLMPFVEAGYRAEDPITLAHEAERLEGLESTPLIVRMRQIVADVQAGRASTGAVA